MLRVALGGLIVLVLSIVGCRSRPAFTRVAPDRVHPSQTPLSIGFWGAGGELHVEGPDLSVLYGRPYAAHAYDTTIDTLGILKNEKPGTYRRLVRHHDRGFLRMTPSLWYGVRKGGSKLQSDGRVSGSGRFNFFKPLSPKSPNGWKVVSSHTSLVRLKIDYPNPAIAGGGIWVTIHEPEGWRLEQIGLSPTGRYTVNFGSAWEDPLSIGNDPKVSEGDRPRYQMVPTVWAEETKSVLENPSTGERRTATTPTGWIVAAGRFSLIDGSGR